MFLPPMHGAGVSTTARNERSFLGHQLSSGLPMSSRGPFQRVVFSTSHRCHLKGAGLPGYLKQDKTKMQAKTQKHSRPRRRTRPPNTSDRCFANPSRKISFDTGTKYLASKSRLTRAQKCRILCGRGGLQQYFSLPLQSEDFMYMYLELGA